MSAVSLERSSPGPGFFGKLPDRGDFVTRWLPKSFVDPWDAWLQACLATSQGQLGSAWEESYMTSPIWRFAVPAQLISKGLSPSGAVAGVLMPSVDRVGRCYPLTIACILEDQESLARLPLDRDWFELLERTSLAALDDLTTLEGLEALVEDIGLPDCEPGAAATGEAFSVGYAEGAGAVQLRCGLTAGVPDYAALLDHLLGRGLGSYSLWWSLGSDRVAPTTTVFSGLPEAGCFAELMTGDKQEAAAAPGAVMAPQAATSSLPPEVKDDIDDLLA